MAECALCHRKSAEISRALGLCADCILADSEAARSCAAKVHRRSRAQFRLPGEALCDEDGVRCTRCVNACRIAPGSVSDGGAGAATKSRLLDPV